eukprot:3937236-Rhodomonas_salina.1
MELSMSWYIVTSERLINLITRVTSLPTTSVPKSMISGSNSTPPPDPTAPVRQYRTARSTGVGRYLSRTHSGTFSAGACYACSAWYRRPLRQYWTARRVRAGQ